MVHFEVTRREESNGAVHCPKNLPHLDVIRVIWKMRRKSVSMGGKKSGEERLGQEGEWSKQKTFSPRHATSSNIAPLQISFPPLRIVFGDRGVIFQIYFESRYNRDIQKVQARMSFTEVTFTLYLRYSACIARI